MKKYTVLAPLLFAFVACGGASEREPQVETSPPDPVEVSSTELLPNAVVPEEGLLSGGQPSSEQLEALRYAGYLTVINLRTEEEEGSGRFEVEELGMNYVALPITGADGLTEENALAFASILEEAQKPAVVHCGSGNRVGALFALKAFYVDGASADEAIEIGLASGVTGLESSVREHLAVAEPAAEEPAESPVE